MIDNAVAHYEHLIQQGVEHPDAIQHAVQRFGVPTGVLQARIAGGVAQHAATMEALAKARSLLLDEVAYDHDETDDIVRDLYNAITGEEV